MVVGVVDHGRHTPWDHGTGMSERGDMDHYMVHEASSHSYAFHLFRMLYYCEPNKVISAVNWVKV